MKSKLKTKKSIVKRFKITATGKLKHPVGKWQHKRINRSVGAHTRSGVERTVKSSTQTRAMRRHMGKHK